MDTVSIRTTDHTQWWLWVDPRDIAVDADGLELPPHIVEIAIKWLMYQYGLTGEEARAAMTSQRVGPTRQRQRQEAIDVADFVGTLK